MTNIAAVLIAGPARDVIVRGLAPFEVHRLAAATDREVFIGSIANVRAIAVTLHLEQVTEALLAQLPKVEIISSFGVGYDNIDTAAAAKRGIIVTHTPDVLNEEVADTALGLLLCTVREFPQAERHLRAGKWVEGDYRLSRATLRNRTVGLIGMGRIGRAIARRLEAFGVPIAYHTRQPRPELSYRYYPNLVDMARAVDVLLTILPGGPGTRHVVNAEVLEALGPDGIFINVARGSVVDQAALIAALGAGKILAAGLDVFANEPDVPKELLAMDNVVLFPHVGSGSLFTREKMDQLVVDNILAWAAGKAPLTPVPETPWRAWKKPQGKSGTAA